MGTTSLTRFAPLMRDPDPCGARSAAQELWIDRGIIVIFPDTLKAMGGLERTLIETIATKHYGKRA